jgi:hypothetical protein
VEAPHTNLLVANLQRKAAASCDVKQWTECLELLDEAKKWTPRGIEPGGEGVEGTGDAGVRRSRKEG